MNKRMYFKLFYFVACNLRLASSIDIKFDLTSLLMHSNLGLQY